MGLYYERQLEAKIGRQKEEITRLLAENAELKGLNSAICDVCKNDEFLKETAEQARAEGQEKAWELAKKCMLMTDRKREAIFGSGHNALYGVLTYFDYKHAAAKVAEWERKNEEICVGDIYSYCGVGNFVICDIDREKDIVKILWDDLSVGTETLNEIKNDYKKTGRHIDVASMLAYIGGESE